MTLMRHHVETPAPMRRPLPRSRRLLRPLALLATLAAVALVTASWPSPGQGVGSVIGIDPGPSAAGPITVAGVTSGLIWADDAAAPTTVTVKNTSDAAVKTMIWWILGRVDDTQPWNDPAMESDQVQLTVAANATTTVSLPSSGAAVAKPGIYRLSLWAHDLDPATGQWVHSDGREMLGNVQVIATPTNVLHETPASAGLWIDDAAPASRWTAARPAQLRVQVVNASAVLKTVQVRWFLTSAPTATPWEDPAATSIVATSTVSPASVAALDVPIDRLPAAGRGYLSVWLYESGPAGDSPQDGIALQSPVTVSR